MRLGGGANTELLWGPTQDFGQPGQAGGWASQAWFSAGLSVALSGSL